MKFKFISLVFFCIGLELFSQGDATISGRIYDKSTSGPLPYATVVLTGIFDDKLLTGAISDDEGRFLLTGIAQGDYLVKCSFVGYKSSETEVLVGRLNRNFDLGRIELEPEAATLGEVVISEDRDLVATTPEKKTFDISGNISQSGGSVLDVMRNLPGITVDQEGKVELRGSDKVSILIDGQQSSLTGYGSQKGLSAIPAMNIERIEIINNPSSKYDAAGMAGIINIIYKKETQTGLHGDAGFTFHLNDSSYIRISNDYTHILATEHTTAFTIDYMKPLKSGRIEAGSKLQLRRIPVTYTVDRGLESIIYPGIGDWSDWGEDIYSGYINWICETMRIEIEGGLRAEGTLVLYDLDNENNSLSLYFNRRIDRPGEPELRVFPKYDDPELLKVGNPYLRPQFTNTYELSYKL